MAKRQQRLSYRKQKVMNWSGWRERPRRIFQIAAAGVTNAATAVRFEIGSQYIVGVGATGLRASKSMISLTSRVRRSPIGEIFVDSAAGQTVEPCRTDQARMAASVMRALFHCRVGDFPMTEGWAFLPRVKGCDPCVGSELRTLHFGYFSPRLRWTPYSNSCICFRCQDPADQGRLVSLASRQSAVIAFLLHRRWVGGPLTG